MDASTLSVRVMLGFEVGVGLNERDAMSKE